jgi:hypothetical protein
VRRYSGIILFLFFFALPFHFHPVINTQQLSQECSCYCGGLSQLGSAPAKVVLSPVYEMFLATTPTATTAVAVTIESESARAPPDSL